MALWGKNQEQEITDNGMVAESADEYGAKSTRLTGEKMKIKWSAILKIMSKDSYKDTYFIVLQDYDNDSRIRFLNNCGFEDPWFAKDFEREFKISIAKVTDEAIDIDFCVKVGDHYTDHEGDWKITAVNGLEATIECIDTEDDDIMIGDQAVVSVLEAEYYLFLDDEWN